MGGRSSTPLNTFPIFSISIVIFIFSVLQILASLFIFIARFELLTIGQGEIVNTIVFLSGILTLPISLSILYHLQSTSSKGYKTPLSAWYWINLLAAMLVNIIGVIVSILSIINGQLQLSQNITKRMAHYRSVPEAKHEMDNLQWILKCCGLNSYRDWYNYDWLDASMDTIWTQSSHKRQFYQSLMASDTDQYPDLSRIRRDSVPYSCCKSGVCVADSLVELGTNFIYMQGCQPKLFSFIRLCTIIVFVLFTFLTAIEFVLFNKLLLYTTYGIPKKNKLTERAFSKIYALNDDRKLFNFAEHQFSTDSECAVLGSSINDKDVPENDCAPFYTFMTENEISNQNLGAFTLMQWEEIKEKSAYDHNNGDIACITPSTHVQHMVHNY